MSANATQPIELKIFGNDIAQLELYSIEAAKIVSAHPKTRDVKNSMEEGSPEIHFTVNRDKAMLYALTPLQIASTIRTASQGAIVGVFRDKGDEINIRVQYKPEQRNTLEDFAEFRINSPLGFSVPLNQLITQSFSSGHTRIEREGQIRKATVTANIIGSDLAGITKELQTKLDPFIKSLPLGYNLEFGGSYKEMVEGFKTLALALTLSIILIYIVMASQFESLKQPFIMMLTVPLCFIGATFGLFITGQTLSVISFVGLIILVGIITNNGIVLVDYINQLKNEGMETNAALIKAGHDRIRPVLITSVSTIIALLPLAFSVGEGAEMKVPLSVTIVGGLTSATIMTLLVIPVLYSIFEKKQ
jgi:HAE1 family hydrophobic/amphiphilic exporter-1